MGVVTNQLMVLTQITLSWLVVALVSAPSSTELSAVSSFHELIPNTLDLIRRQHIGMNHLQTLSLVALFKLVNLWKLNNWLPTDWYWTWKEFFYQEIWTALSGYLTVRLLTVLDWRDVTLDGLLSAGNLRLWRKSSRLSGNLTVLKEILAPRVFSEQAFSESPFPE